MSTTPLSQAERERLGQEFLALADEDHSCEKLLTPEEMDDLDISIQADCIAQKLVLMGIVF